MIEQLKNAVDYFRDLILNDLDHVWCWIGGGAIRDFFLYGRVLEEYSDVDIFFADQSNYNIARRHFESNGFEMIYENENASRWSKLDGKSCIFELIKRFYPDPKITINNFDFTVCCCAIDRAGIYYHETYFIDLAGKNLVLNNTNNPEGTFNRVKKYIDKGFNIDRKQISILFSSISIRNEPISSSSNEIHVYHRPVSSSHNETLQFNSTTVPQIPRIDNVPQHQRGRNVQIDATQITAIRRTPSAVPIAEIREQIGEQIVRASNRVYGNQLRPSPRQRLNTVTSLFIQNNEEELIQQITQEINTEIEATVSRALHTIEREADVIQR